VRWAIAAVIVAASLMPRLARAQEPPSDTVTYRVKPGDSLELIAAEFYGDRAKAMFIMVDNKLTRPRSLKPGERLRIPISRDVVTAPGDTFESLAATYLGDARRGTFLADFNGLSVDDSVPAGSVLTVPFTITHVATYLETVADVAKAYFGDSRNAELIRRYNFLDKPTIERGESVIVPVYHVRLAAAKLPALDADARARRDHRRDVVARAAKALPAAHQAWKDGDFAAVKAAIGDLEPELDYLDAADAADICVLLGGMHAADNDPDGAEATFKRALERQPHLALRRYQYSPKITGLWQKAGGQVE
jgi:LysM repeat protein